MAEIPDDLGWDGSEDDVWDDYADRCFICGCSGQPCDCPLSDDESDHEGEDNDD